MRRWRVVYFDDDINQVESLRDYLSSRLNISGTNDISSYERYLETNPDLILIDVHMPFVSGFSLYEKIKSSPHYNGCPLMFISGDISPENKLKSFQIGADDFIPRDLEESEFCARLINKIRSFRNTALKMTIDNLTLDLENFTVLVNDKVIAVTLNELKVLGVILRSYPKVCARTSLIKKIWGEEAIKPSTVNAHMSSLNSKLREWSYELKFKRDEILVVLKENN